MPERLLKRIQAAFLSGRYDLTYHAVEEMAEEKMYGFKCEHCDGIVREHIVKREAFTHRNGFVILEDVPVGICDVCGYHYYHASLIHLVEEIASGRQSAKRMEQVPVAGFA